jgi:ubiquinone/menaquinone biosynthesis C-methylase UbiE
MTSLSEIRENWEGFAQADPLWAICVDSEKSGGRWTKEEFFATGEREISKVMGHLRSLGLSPAKTAVALDFGCGVGRLTRALSQHFDMCWGVDISPTMIHLAKDFHASNPRCKFWLNEVDNLRRFEDGHFGFIYTSITLQHIPVHYLRNYLLEFVRVLKPGGIFVFQVPDRDNRGVPLRIENFLGVRRRLKRLGRLVVGKRIETLRMDMTCFPEEKIRELFSDQGVRIVDVKLTNSAQGSFNGNLQFLEPELKRGWVSKQYCVVKAT